MAMNLDAYYRGLAAEELQALGDRLLTLSREAEQAEAHSAAWHLSDLSTQLLDMGLNVGNANTPPSSDEPL
jgi:hypothetical protein